MNKKFSTLLASFLLAGGLFSTANAIDLRTAVDGQYYMLRGASSLENSTWVPRSETNPYCLVNKNGKILFAQNAEGKDAYWTIETRSIQSGKDVRFVNVATGRPLTLTASNGESSEWFRVDYYQHGGGAMGLSLNGVDANIVKWGDNYHLGTIIDGTDRVVTTDLATDT